MTEHRRNLQYDLILVGGGLANCLLALSLAQRVPSFRWLLIEADDKLGGAHHWSFLLEDLARSKKMFPQHVWVDHLIAKRWPSYNVAFNKYSRNIKLPFGVMTATDIHSLVTKTCPLSQIKLNTKVEKIVGDRVFLEHNHLPITGRLVIDGRAKPYPAEIKSFQKSLIQIWQTNRPHGIKVPVWVDGRLDQKRGLNTLSVIPWGQNSLLIQDRFVQKSPIFNGSKSRMTIHNFLKASRLTPVRMLEEQQSVQPVVTQGSLLRVSPSCYRDQRFDHALYEALAFSSNVQSLPEKACIKTVFAQTSNKMMKAKRKSKNFNGAMVDTLRPEDRVKFLENLYQMPLQVLKNYHRGKLSPVEWVQFGFNRGPIGVRDSIKLALH